MARPASATLPHFPPPPGLAGPPGLRRLNETAAVAVVQPRRPDENLEKVRREAIAEAEARFEQMRAADRAEFHRQLAERDRGMNEVAVTLSARMEAGLAQIEGRLTAEVARTLRRFIGSAVLERALGELTDTVKALLVRKAGASVRISGPEALVDAIHARLGEGAAPIACHAEPGATDLTVTVDDTAIRTAVVEWIGRLSAATTIGQAAGG